MTHPDLAVPSASDTAHLVKYASLVTRSPEAGLQFNQTMRNNGG